MINGHPVELGDQPAACNLKDPSEGQLITIAIGLFVLARSGRSWPLATFAAAFLALALVANLYDMENVAYRLGLGSPGFQTNVIVAAVTCCWAGSASGWLV